MTVRRIVHRRTDACCICKTAVTLTTATTDDPEAPEMLQPPPGAWLGYVQDPSSSFNPPRLVVCCSDACANKLLMEEP